MGQDTNTNYDANPSFILSMKSEIGAINHNIHKSPGLCQTQCRQKVEAYLNIRFKKTAEKTSLNS